MSKRRTCKDCRALPVEEAPRIPRKVTHPGPRCTTHGQLEARRAKAARHDAEVARVFGLPRGFYSALLAAQGERCAICARPGRRLSKRLAVDHDHTCCPRPPVCGRCVRGLLCHPCNEYLGRVARDDVGTFARGLRYLRELPAQTLLISFTEDAA